MKLSDKKSVQQIVMTLASLGVTEVIICPGSRNAPLILSFNRHPAFHCTSIRDERSAAFFALGKSLQLRQPVALVCTSGSAALNFAPAIAEAYYQRIPLLVFTADRPAEWTGQGDGQTIWQTDIYHNYIRKSYTLYGDADSANEYWHNQRCLHEGFSIATQNDAGPVHFNIPLQEPLYGAAVAEDFVPAKFEQVSPEHRLTTEQLATFRQLYAQSKKVMILAGQQWHEDELNNIIQAFEPFENTVVLTESTSNIDADFTIKNIDRCITTLDETGAPHYMPDLLITVGGAIVSKRIKALLRKYKPALHWNIHPYDAQVDTYQSLTHPVFMEAPAFLSQLLPELSAAPSGYRQIWQKRNAALQSLHDDFSSTAAYSDFYVFDHLFKKIPGDQVLHLGNSSPVRYAQLFTNGQHIRTWSNRGTSGIDGCTSTVMGCAAANPQKQFLLITGDVAFFYDNNALWNDGRVNNLRIILINNGGGGIFRIISGAEAAGEMETFFETAHHKSAKKLAEFYEWNYLAASDAPSLQASLQSFFEPGNEKSILEIFTPADVNPQVLNNYWKFLKEKYTTDEQTKLGNHQSV